MYRTKTSHPPPTQTFTWLAYYVHFLSTVSHPKILSLAVKSFQHVQTVLVFLMRFCRHVTCNHMAVACWLFLAMCLLKHATVRKNFYFEGESSPSPACVILSLSSYSISSYQVSKCDKTTGNCSNLLATKAITLQVFDGASLFATNFVHWYLVTL